MKRIDIEVEQSHLKRDDLKAAQEEADLWQAKYYQLFVEAKELDVTQRLEIAQLKEVVGNLRERLRIYEKNDTDAQ